MRNNTTLIGRWTFDGLGGPWDETENWQKIEFHGGAKLTHRGLELKSNQWARVVPSENATFDIKEKTLISWIILDDLSESNTGGSALTLDSKEEDKFDGIIFGERSNNTWMAGSNQGHRWSD